MKKLFEEHLQICIAKVSALLEKKGLQRLFIDNGLHDYYFLDDQPVNFKGNPLFAYFCPAVGEGHILEICPGQKPILHFFSPPDFWHQTPSFADQFWTQSFQVQIFSDHSDFWSKAHRQASRIISPHPETAVEEGFALAEQEILDALYWYRTQKTPYEIACLKEASRLASFGHIAAKDCFFAGASEYEIMQAYLNATNQREKELPYNNIIALNEHAAILHYQNLDRTLKGQSFLIDAGFRYNSYCSDISRTYCREQAHPVFKSLIDQIGILQKQLISQVTVGASYPDLHAKAFFDIGQILLDQGVLKSASAATQPSVVQAFFPHGLGHPLGIQVHDVAGKQLDEGGRPAAKDPRFPFLRTLRKVQPNDVLTIEPGIYFIPQLLNPLRTSKAFATELNWNLIDQLIPLGGIRIEDNIWVSSEGPINLTREFLP